jgi:hypothetical protein
MNYLLVLDRLNTIELLLRMLLAELKPCVKFGDTENSNQNAKLINFTIID